MVESILNNKNILAIDDEPDVLRILDEEITWVAPKCRFEKATTYAEATKKLESQTYDVVILDLMGIRGFDLLDLAVTKNLRVAVLTAHALTPEALKKSIELGAWAYLPKDKLGEVVPFIEDVLRYDYSPGWNRLMKTLEEFFNARWGELWKKSEEKFWKDFEKKTSVRR